MSSGVSSDSSLVDSSSFAGVSSLSGVSSFSGVSSLAGVSSFAGVSSPSLAVSALGEKKLNRENEEAAFSSNKLAILDTGVSLVSSCFSLFSSRSTDPTNQPVFWNSTLCAFFRLFFALCTFLRLLFIDLAARRLGGVLPLFLLVFLGILLLDVRIGSGEIVLLVVLEGSEKSRGERAHIGFG